VANAILNLAWQARGVSPAEKLVLARLADFAGSDGERCFPSHERVAADCGLTARSLGKVLKSLAAKKHLTIKERCAHSAKVSSRFGYVIHPAIPERRSCVTPDRHDATPELDDTPHRNAAPAPIKEPPVLTTNNPAPRKSASPPVVIPESLNTPGFSGVWGEWLEHLRQKRKPATALAQARQLKKLTALGPDKAIETIVHCIEHNWQGLYDNTGTNSKRPAQTNSRNAGITTDTAKQSVGIVAELEARRRREATATAAK
jgi:enamine deaminase RidA (YjgF/YER057c/UK114 family)